MKTKCSKFLSVFFSLLGLVFLFAHPIQAANTLSISQDNTDIYTDYFAFGTTGSEKYQSFTAVNDNISQISLYLWSPNGCSSDITMYVCEISSPSDTGACLNTPIASDAKAYGSLTSTSWNTWTFSTLLLTEIGHYYKLYMTHTGTENCLQQFTREGSNDYTGGNLHYDNSYGYLPRDMTFRIYYDDAYSAISGSVYWAGVGTQYGQIGGNWNIPVYWNVCEFYDDIKSAGIYLNLGEGQGNNTIIQDKTEFIGPQRCQGISYITSPIQTSTSSNGTTTIMLDITAFDDTTTQIESSPFNYIVNSGGTTANYLDPVNDWIVNLPTNNATTTLLANYEFAGLAWEDGKICVYNDDSRAVTTICTDVTTENGLANINFPDANSPYTLNLHYALYSETDINLFNGPSFQINWIGEYKPSDAFQNLLDVTSHDLACDNDQWNTPDPVLDFGFATSSIPAFNFTKIGCQFMEKLYNVGGKISTGLTNSLEKITAKTINIFPFVFPVQVKKSWDDATTTALPDELAFLSIGDNNGNIDISGPNFSGNGTTTWHVWGPNLWSNSSTINTMLTNWRILTKYLLYAAWFLIIIWAFVTKVINRLK